MVHSGRDIATWGEYARTNPDQAKIVADVFQSHPHHVVATIRSDGSPRLGGTSVFFTEEDLWIGTKTDSFRAKDLHRDSRCALYSAPIDEHLVRPDIQIDGVASLADNDVTHKLLSAVGEPDGAAVFLLQICALRILTVDRDELVIETWSPVTGTKIRRISAEVEA